jgi:hypothetical protein
MVASMDMMMVVPMVLTKADKSVDLMEVLMAGLMVERTAVPTAD